MILINKYECIGNPYIFLHNTFYHVMPYGHKEHYALYQGHTNKLSDYAPCIFKDGNYLYFPDFENMLTYKYDGQNSKIISEKSAVGDKVGNVYIGSSGIMFDKNFNKIEGIDLANKSLLYSNEKVYIYIKAYKKASLPTTEQDIKSEQRNRMDIECTDLNHNVLWIYSTDHLGFEEKKENKEVLIVDPITNEPVNTRYELFITQEPIRFSYEPLVVRDIMLLATQHQQNPSWTIAIDITTGKELYVIKYVEGMAINSHFIPPPKPPTYHGIGMLQYHEKEDIVYSFGSNVYVEMDYRTGKILTIENRGNEFIFLYKSSGDNYQRIDDIIYYTTDMDIEGDKKTCTPYLIGYDVKLKEIVFEYPLGKSYKQKLLFRGARFEIINNLFYMLDGKNTLWVYEDEDFYKRHPMAQIVP